MDDEHRPGMKRRSARNSQRQNRVREEAEEVMFFRKGENILIQAWRMRRRH